VDSGHVERKYPLLTRSKTLPFHTDDAAVIREVALGLWHEAKVGEDIRLLGVTVSNLVEEPEQQLPLFMTDAQERSRKLGPALDAIRKRFGEGAIAVATKDPEKATPSLRKKHGET
jgi:hypothetical protein